MSALTQYRAVEQVGDRQSADYYQPLTIADGIYIYGGSLLFLNSSGEVVVASPDQTMTCVGFHHGADIDNTDDGETVVPHRGVIDLANNGASIAADDIGKLAYAVDNQTVDLDSGSGTRCAVGSIEGIRSDGRVYVKVGMEGVRALQTLEQVQPIDADLTAIAALAGTSGVLAKTAANTWALRTLTAPAAGFTITNPAGVAGDPTFVLADDLAGLEAMSSTGFVSRTGSATYANRAIQAASAGVTISNGDGVSGNPQVDNLFAPIELADPGDGQAIPVTRSYYVGLTFNGTETNTLAIPTFAGQRMILYADTATSGTRAVTAAQAINVAGNTIMTFNAARDYIELVGVKVGGALRWEVASNSNVALS